MSITLSDFSNKTKLISSIYCVIGLLLFIFVFDCAWYEYLILFIYFLPVFLTVLNLPINVELEKNSIIIYKLLWKKHIELIELQSCISINRLRNDDLTRVFGIFGIFGFFGLFSHKKHGTLFVTSTRMENLLILKFKTGIPHVISIPKNRENFPNLLLDNTIVEQE